MSRNGKLMEMLTGYAAAHQHPVNVFVHMIGIPMILFGVLVPLTWASVEVGGMTISLAHAAVFGFFLFYLTLDRLFAVVFLVVALLIAQVAEHIGTGPRATAGIIAAIAFFGGFAAQFAGHAIEKAMPVLVRHPIQAALAAPFFVVVEAFKFLGLRDDLFEAVQLQIEQRRTRES